MAIGFVVNWLLTSATLTIVAIGFTLVFGVGSVLNLAHGTSIVLGGFSAYIAVNAGYSIWVGLVLAIAVPMVFNAVLYLAMVRKVDDEPITTMIVTFVVFLIVEHLFLVIYGDQPRSIPSLIPGSTDVLGYSVQLNQIGLFVLSWLVVGGLFAFTNYTRMGKATMAMSMSKKGTKLVGIDYTRINLLTWMIAAGMAGLAGLFIGSSQTVTWDMGLTPLLMSFVIVILGGIGSIRGSVIGAYIIGLVEMVTVYGIDPTLRVFTPLVVLLVVLLVKPTGLFGREFVE